MNEFISVVQETAKFLRGQYRLDEVAGKYYDSQCIRFRQGSKTIVTVLLHTDYLEFLVVLGKAEQEKFEEQRNEFSKEIRELFDKERALHDGKWLMIRVDSISTLEVVKKLILIKKKPNRKPASKENAVYGKCGHRCDHCVHFTGITEEFRDMLIPHLVAVYGIPDWSMRCTGCDTPGCQCYHEGNEVCPPINCIKNKKLNTCMECQEYPCKEATVGYKCLEPKNITADDVTWAILPYVPNQYER